MSWRVPCRPLPAVVAQIVFRRQSPVSYCGFTIAYSGGGSLHLRSNRAIAFYATPSAGLLEVRGRFYSFAKRFFVDLGPGYGVPGSISTQINGILFSPGLGWKFDPGKADGFVIDLCVCSDRVFEMPPLARETPGNGVNPVYHPDIATPVVNMKLLFGYVF